MEQNSSQPATNIVTEAPHTQNTPADVQATPDSETDDQRTFASPTDWGDRRDTAHPAKQSAERFDPDNTGRTGNGQLSGKITQIRYDLRRFEVSPGQWVREFTVPIKLVSDNGSVPPEALKQLGDKVSQSIETNYNRQYHLPGGDQLHITVEFDPSGVPVEVIDSTVDKGRPETNQAQWDVRDDPDGLTHEVLHFLGLGEGYADPDMLFNRQDQPGIMGKDAWNGATFLTDQNLGKIDEVAQTAGPIRDHGLDDQSAPPTGRPTGNPSPDFGPNSLHTPSKAPPVTLTADQVRAALPDYLANSKGIGPSKQLRPTNNADIRPGLITLSPQLKGNPALDIIQGQIDTNAGSFLGKGRPFTIKVGKRSMELTVTGAFDWAGMTVDNTATDTEKAKPSGKDTRKSDNSASDSRNTDLNLSGFMSAVPPLVISAGVQVPTGINTAHDAKTSKDVGSSSNVEVDGMRQVKAPITFTYALVDSDNHRVGPVDQSGQPVVTSVTGDVDLSVPTTFTKPDNVQLKVLTQAPPTKFGVEEAVSTTPNGDFFQQVAADLPTHLKEIGAPGRSVLQNFLSDANIKKNLPVMTVYDGTANPDKGWIRSDPLIKNSNSKKWSSKGNAVEMRAVARRVQVIETVDGVKNTDTDSYKNVTSEKNSAKHNVGGNLMIGGGADVGAVFFAVGPSVAWSRESEKSQEHTQTNVSKNSAERTGEAVRYHTVYDIQVRSVGHPAQTLTGQVDAHLWATKDRADNAQIAPTPPPVPVARQGGARTHYAPSHIEHGQSLGGSVIDDFSGGDKLYRSIVDVLQNVPGRKAYHLSSDKFVRQFDNADFAGGLSASVNDILSRDDKVRTSLSDQQLSHLIDTMLTGQGLTIPLVKNGTFHDYHTNITLRARLNSVGDLELLSSPQNNGPSGDKTVGTSKTKEKTGTAFADTITKNLNIGVQARVTGGLGKASGTALGAVKGGKIWTNSTKVGSDSKSSINRTHGDTLGVDGDLGAREFRQFTGNLTITPQVSSYVRLNVNTRRISFGSHGRSVPALVPNNRTPGAGQPAAQNIPLRLLVPEILVTTVPPAQVAVITTAPQPIANPTSISHLGVGLSRGLDGVEVVTFLGAEHLQTSAKGQLRDASGDPIFEFADGDNSTRIADRLSPESLKSDPRLFSRPVVVDGLHYGRRAADVDGQVAVVLTPVNPQVVSAAEYQKIKQIQAGGSSVGKSKGNTSSVEATFTGVAAMSGPATSTVGNVKNNAFGVFIAAVTPWGKNWGNTKGGDLKSAEKTTFENGPVKKTLVRVNIDAQVVAETRVKGNIDKFGLIRGQDLSRSGERFSMPGSVLMWVTDSQLAELQNTPQPAPAAVVHPPNRTLPPPVSMGRNQVSSLGIGGVTSTIDLTASIANLHTALVTNMGREAANRLLPASSLDTSHDNHRELNRFLSDVNRSVNNTLNGGKITPLRLEDKWSGRTYYVTLDARVTAAPTFTGIDHVDKLSTEDAVTVSTTKEKTSSRTIGGFFASLRPSVRMVETVDPVPSGQAPQTKGHGPSSGTISGGLSADGSASTKSTKDITTAKTDYKQSASISGPVGSYTAPMDFDIRIERRLGVDVNGNERANQLVATDTAHVTGIRIQKLAEESLPTPTGGAARHGVAGPINSVAARGDAPTNAWRQATGHAMLPGTGTFSVEHFFGDMTDVRKAAEQAITESGVTVDTATIAALKAGITPAAFKAGLPAMVNGEFTLPLPGKLGRDLEIHARLGADPRLGSVSAGVEIDGSAKKSDEDKTERKTGPTLSVTGIAPNAGGGVSHPSGASQPGERRPFGGVFAGTQNDYKLGGKNKQVELKAGTPANTTTSPQSATAIKTDDKITQAMLHHVEFRFVARPKSGQTTEQTGITTMNVDEGYVVRTRPDPANPLPASMTAAATALTDAGKTWSDAVKTLDGLNNQPVRPDTTAAQTAVTDAETAWWQARDTYHQELDSARMTQAERDQAEADRQAREDAEQRRRDEAARVERERVEAERQAAEDRQRREDEAQAERDRQAAKDKADADRRAAEEQKRADEARAERERLAQVERDRAEAARQAEEKRLADEARAEQERLAQIERDKAEAERRAAEEQRIAADKAAEKAAAEQKLVEQRAAEQRAAEQRAAERRAAEQKLAEQKAAELRATEQREAEERVAREQAEKEAAEAKTLAERNTTPEPTNHDTPEQLPPEQRDQAEEGTPAETNQPTDEETDSDEETDTDEDSEPEDVPQDSTPKRDDEDGDPDPQQDESGHTDQDQPEQQQERRTPEVEAPQSDHDTGTRHGEQRSQNRTEPESPTNDDFPGDLGGTESIEMVEFSGPALEDIDFVPLRNAAGDVVGVGFPRAGESEILLAAFTNNAGQDNEFAVAVHHDADGFAVTRRDGTEVRLDERGVVRLMRSADNGWQRNASLVFLSCDVTSTELRALTNLVREQGFEGRVRGPDGRVEIAAGGDVRVLDGGAFRNSEGVRQADSGTFDASGGTVVFTPRPNLTAAYRTVQPGGVTAFESVRPLRIGMDLGGDFPAFSTAAAGFETHVHPMLRTTDDRSMAINGTNSVNGVDATREPREFFATPEIIAAAQEALNRLNSGVELEVQPAAVVLGEGFVLQRVTPRPLNPAQDVCRDFSAQIHGASPDALLFRDLEGNIVQAPVRTQDGVEITGAYHLADGLAALVEQGTPNVDALTAADFVARDSRPAGGIAGRPLPGVRYGSLLNPSNDTSGMDVVAERTGVNQHAWARPGEMYVMSSIPGETANGEADFDVNASRDTGVSGRWGYHFATVIAESADGRSQITLENYARRGQIDRAVRESVDRNLTHHAGDLTRIVTDLDNRIAAARNPDEATELGRRRAFAAALVEIEATGFDAAPPQVRQRVRRAAVADLKLPPLGRQWHFKMYTKNPGESFFDQHALTYEPGGVSAGVNPLVTVAIGGMHAVGSVAVAFERGRRDAENGELGGVRQVARRVARAAIWRNANGMPLPSVVVTGYGNGGRLGPMRARATGLARARTVEAAFRAELAAELTRLQGDRWMVRPEDVQVRPVAANVHGNGDPSLRRATLEVVFGEDSSPVPEAPTEGEIGTPGAQQHQGSVLDDRSWLHSTASTADWMIDSDPADADKIDAARGNAKAMTVSIEDTGVVRGTITSNGERPKIELKHWRHPIAYDLRRMEVAPGKWVQEYTVRLGFKNATPEEIQALVTRAQAGIDHFYNDPGYRLPSGDQLRVRLEQGPLPHATIDVRPEGGPVDQLSWTPTTHEAVLAHEFGHFLGFYDEYPRHDGHGGTWVFRGGGHAAGGRVAADRVVRDDGLFTAHLHAYVNDTTGAVAEPTLKPRNLWLLETRTTAIGSNVTPAPLDTEVPGDDDDAFPLLLELWSDAAPASEHPEPDDDVLGQDLFGMRKTPPAPAFPPEQLDALAEHSPKLVHAVSLGSVELPESHDGWLTVLWTDVPRSELRLEPSENVVVVTVDEVFNAESPMSLQPFFATEMAKPDGRPEDILRLEILRRFGGVSVEGDLHDLDLSQVDLNQPWSHDSTDNDVFALPKGHPVTTALLDQLRDGYRRPEPLPVSPDVDDLSTTELTKKIIQTLVRGLKVRDGDLHLNAVAAVLAGHSKAGVVWTAVLTFLASRPELAAQVNTVTWHHYGIADELAILRKILLSRAANQLLDISPTPPPQPFPGELTQTAALNWPDWL